ncbi:MAG: hypothetical protein JNK58_07115 [Phycisphaerae bacterium]|nr:hypothetical protein [Phycisphaerae bacterium]
MNSEPDRWADVRRQMRLFRGFLAPSLPEFGLVNLTDRQWTDDEYAARKSAHLANPGVYLMYSDSGALIYVGKAEWSLNSRIWSHDAENVFLGAPCRWIDAIVFPRDLSFLVPSLESFLIRTLNPMHNRIGRGYPAATDPEKKPERSEGPA